MSQWLMSEMNTYVLFYTRSQKPCVNKTVLLQTSLNYITPLKRLLRDNKLSTTKSVSTVNLTLCPRLCNWDETYFSASSNCSSFSPHVSTSSASQKKKKKCKLELLWNNLQTILLINNALALLIYMVAIDKASIVHWHHLNKVFLAWHLYHVFQSIKSCLKRKCSE